MSTIAKAVLIGVAIPSIFFSWKLYPNVKSYRDCYKESRELRNQKGYVSRRSYTTEEKICEEDRSLIIGNATCYLVASTYFEDEFAVNISKFLGKQFAFASTEADDLILIHNAKCAESRHSIEYEKDVLKPFKLSLLQVAQP